jgi:hypothetical protein
MPQHWHHGHIGQPIKPRKQSRSRFERNHAIVMWAIGVTGLICSVLFLVPNIL